MVNFLTYLGSGKLLIYLLRKFPPAKQLASKWEFSRELFRCNLCLGFWVYLVLSPFFDVDIKSIKNPIKYIVIASISTWLSHLISTGFSEIHQEVVILDAS